MSKGELLALTATEPKEACYRIIMIMIMIMIMMIIIIINNEKTEEFVTGLLALTVTEPGRDPRFWLTTRVVISTTRVVISTTRVVISTTSVVISTTRVVISTTRVVMSTTRVVISTIRVVIWTMTKNRYRELSVTEPGR
jgi:hypothetical protein